MRILIIDDEASLLDVLALAFEEAGHQIVTARDGMAGLEMIRRERPAVVVSDVNMPGIDGFTLLRRVRESGDRVPMILLTSRDSEVDEALGLELGADDYVAKPFSTRVLLARVAAILRRESLRQTEGWEQPPIEIGEMQLYPERLEARYRGQIIPTTVTEFRLLEALLRRPGIVLSRERLLQIVRGDDSVVTDRIIDTYVRRLRRKLEQVDEQFDRIQTVVGAGYRWRADESN
ncbi:response regulator transcription factor [Polyangium aurulentum]|uniref:response regulator transcription factor n=1 Tax=Polyangium aurulentum TaxID=2567896 RepID=UPI00146B1337|nr:response regulator transcription factor [Polyangium aurulentum]UQA59785.1 response regulator transcription factor [Polyangium aurulentum]